MANGTDAAPPQPPTPPSSSSIPPAPDTGSGGHGGGDGKRAGLVLLVVVLIAGAGVGGYFIGHGAADASGAKRSGLRQGATAVRADYAPGAPGYKAIYAQAFAAGRGTGVKAGVRLGAKRGQAVGFQAGTAKGKATGVADGAAAALGQIGNWQTGSGAFYIVDMNPGNQPGVPFVVQGRHTMEANRLYEICTDDPSQICSQPEPPQ